MLSKQEKIDKILAIVKGEISVADLNQKLTICIGYRDDNIFLINGDEVAEDRFDLAFKNIDPSGFKIVYGGYESGDTKVKNETA